MAKDYGWRTHMGDAELKSTEVLLDKPKRFLRETLVMPDGEQLEWAYVDTPPSVLVVPVLPDGKLVMVYQYRYNLHRYTLEFPAGTVADDETPEEAARRELREETGFELTEGSELRSLGTFYSLPSETNKNTHMYLAGQVSPDGAAVHDSDIERFFNMSVHFRPLSLAIAEIGKSVAGTETITALLLAERAMSVHDQQEEDQEDR